MAASSKKPLTPTRVLLQAVLARLTAAYEASRPHCFVCALAGVRPLPLAWTVYSVRDCAVRVLACDTCFQRALATPGVHVTSSEPVKTLSPLQIAVSLSIEALTKVCP